VITSADDLAAMWRAAFPKYHHGRPGVINLRDRHERAAVIGLLSAGAKIREALPELVVKLFTVEPDGHRFSDAAFCATGDHNVKQLWLKLEFLFALVEHDRATQHDRGDARAAKGWAQILACLESKVPRHAFHTWLMPLVQITDTGSLIEVAKPGDSRVFAEWVTKHHGDVIRAVVQEVRPGARVEIIDIDAIVDAHDHLERHSS
jgi:hypothetical protein